MIKAMAVLAAGPVLEYWDDKNKKGKGKGRGKGKESIKKQKERKKNENEKACQENRKERKRGA